MKPALLMTDCSNGDCQKEAISDFILSWTLRAAADNFPYKNEQERLHLKCKEILSKLILGDYYDKNSNPINKFISVDVWKQWNKIDLHANVILEINGKKEYHLLVIENKAYTKTRENQLHKYKKLINQTYDSDPDLVCFEEKNRHFILITFLNDECNPNVFHLIKEDCLKNGYECISILDLQPNCGIEDTESDIFNEFWLRKW